MLNYVVYLYTTKCLGGEYWKINPKNAFLCVATPFILYKYVYIKICI